MWPFKKRQESPQALAAEERLDEATRETAWEEYGKEANREQHGGYFGPMTTALHRESPEPLQGTAGDPVPEPVDDPDPSDERGLRDVLRDGDAES